MQHFFSLYVLSSASGLLIYSAALLFFNSFNFECGVVMTAKEDPTHRQEEEASVIRVGEVGGWLTVHHSIYFTLGGGRKGRRDGITLQKNEEREIKHSRQMGEGGFHFHPSPFHHP